MGVKHPNPKNAQPQGAYFTPPEATELLLKVEGFPKHVYEPACGKGHISNVLLERGFSVISSDLNDWGYGATGVDFLTKVFVETDFEPKSSGLVTNPPFHLADEFVLRAVELGFKKIALFNKLSWLAGAKRYGTLWRNFPPDRVWILAKRATCWRMDDPNPKSSGGSVDYMWAVWDNPVRKTGVAKAPSIGWLI